MSWVADLASGLGIPAGAATLAVAMYAACAAAEKAARPEALRDIGRILKDRSGSRSVRPAAIIQRVFVWTFGQRHLSWKCIFRSLLATVVILLLLSGFPFFFQMQNEISFIMEHLDAPVADTAKNFPGLSELLQESGASSLSLTRLVLPYLLATVLADYFALWKTRRLLATLKPVAGAGWWRLAVDVVASLLISVLSVLLSMFLMNVLVFDSVPQIGTFLQFQLSGLWKSLAISPFETGFAMTDDGTSTQFSDFLFNDLSVFSTLFTSVWMLLVLLSTTVLKLLTPLQRFTVWFFDFEHHPVKAIGTVSAALVMIGALISTVLRAVI